MIEMKEKSPGKYKAIVQFTTSPLGEGVSVSRFVAAALKEVEKSGIRYQLTPMSTILEADTPEEAIKVILGAHEAVFKAGAKRVVTDIKIDDRRDEPRRMEDKVEKVKKQLDETMPQS
jgi:uncharacterized protein (TIGR00106 family)